jgi:acetyl esterase/lipase
MNPIASRLALFAAALITLLAGCQQTYFRALNARVPAGISQSTEFDSANGLSLDIYRAHGAKSPAPVVVFFYGGAWHDGNRAYYRFVGEALSRRGLLVLIPDYRKAPANVFPAFIDDAASATAWARRHASELGGDPSRIYLMGHSAGAHIAALLATDQRYLGKWNIKPRDLAGVIGLAGPYDFLPITEPRIKEVFGAESNWPSSQPVNFVDGDEPPFLLLHGASDRRVAQRNSQRLAAKLSAAGESVTLNIIPETGHVALVNGFLSARFSPVLEQSIHWIEATGHPGAGADAGSRNLPLK